MKTNNETFGILGYGFVGKASHLGLLNSGEVAIHDILLGTSMEDLKNSKYVLICIPTSTQEDIATLVEEIITLKKINENCTVILRSTVPVGVCKQIQDKINDKIIYMPEFLRERFWNTDCNRRPLIVAHDNTSLPSWIKSEKIIECTFEDAEVLKMFSNNYAAMRIVFANHFYELSQRVGANYQNVLEMYNHVENDQSYLEADEQLRGFGGKCLPKDLDFLIKSFDDLDLSQSLFDSIKQDNTLWKTTVKKS